MCRRWPSSSHAAGYDTAAFVSSFVLDRQFGLARGFDHYDDALDPPPGPDRLAGTRAARRSDGGGGHGLAGRAPGCGGAGPYFLWVHLYDAHDPYTPPAPFAQRFAGRAYDGEIAFDDALVGELLGEGGSRRRRIAAGRRRRRPRREPGRARREHARALRLRRGRPRAAHRLVARGDCRRRGRAAGAAHRRGADAGRARRSHARRRASTDAASCRSWRARPAPARRRRRARLRRDLLPAILHGMGAAPIGARRHLEADRRAGARALRSGRRPGRADQRLRHRAGHRPGAAPAAREHWPAPARSGAARRR